MRWLLTISIVLACSCKGAGDFPPDEVMRAAGWDVDRATRSTPRWEPNSEHPVYEIMYRFPDQTMFLKVDPQTSETIEISGQYGRGPNPTSDTATLTNDWARRMLQDLNVHKASQGLVYLAPPEFFYDTEMAQYDILFPRVDSAGHPFMHEGVSFGFDHGTSRVTHLSCTFQLPEPAITTGSMISETQAVNIARTALDDKKAIFFKYFSPDTMEFTLSPAPIKINVRQKNNVFHSEVSRLEDVVDSDETAVAYSVGFDSHPVEDYRGPYEHVAVGVFVEVFTGEVVAGSDFGELVLPKE